jgi:hypothetical protein
MIAVCRDLANKGATELAGGGLQAALTRLFGSLIPATPNPVPSGTEATLLKKIVIGAAAIFSLLLFTFLGLCLWASFYAQGSTSCQLASGRQIACTATGIYISMETHQDTAIIRTLSRTVAVMPTNLQVDGRTVATIPATTKSVNVAIEGGEVTFVADGQTVGSVRR